MRKQKDRSGGENIVTVDTMITKLSISGESYQNDECDMKSKKSKSVDQPVRINTHIMHGNNNTTRIIMAPTRSPSSQKRSDITSKDVSTKAYKYSREFLGGIWADIDPNLINIQPVSGGLSNLLYLVSLPAEVTPYNGEPRRVLLRIYGQLLQECMDTVVVDSVIFALLSEKRLGPKLYGVFPGGRVEEYIPTRSLMTKELHDPHISERIAKIMRNFHSLDMPLSKTPRWIFDITTKWMRECREFVKGSKITSKTVRPINERFRNLMAHNFEEEFDWLKQTLLLVKSPVVFCHNDFQEGNILYMPAGDCSGSFELMPIDFEYCSYNYRGFELGNHFCEWTLDYKVEAPLSFIHQSDKYPTREEQVRFVEAYLRAGPRSEGPEDDVDSILLEANTFALASHFMWVLWSLIQYNISIIEFDYLGYAEARLNCYYKLKNNLALPLSNSATDDRHVISSRDPNNDSV